MGLEAQSTNTISGLNDNNPTNEDFLHDSAAHLRLIKYVLKHCFPGEKGFGLAEPITASEDDFNTLPGMWDVLKSSYLGVVPPGNNPPEKNPLPDQTLPAWYTAVENWIHETKQKLVDLTKNAQLPIGSIYMNADVGTNPATLLGYGTWEPFGQQRVLVGVDTSLPAGGDLSPYFRAAGIKRGSGSLSHNHVQEQAALSGGSIQVNSSVFDVDLPPVQLSVANYPPYVTVYMWRRIADAK